MGDRAVGSPGNGRPLVLILGGGFGGVGAAQKLKDADADVREQVAFALGQIRDPRAIEGLTGALKDGWPARAPYDVILLEGAAEVPPRALFPQLADGGRLVCIEGRDLAGRAMVYRAAAGQVSGRSVFGAAAPLLPGFARPPAFVF